MDLFKGRYFNMNRLLLTCIGFWPYALKSKMPVRIIVMTVDLLLILPQIVSAIIHHDDIDRLMLNMVCFFCATFMFLKMIALCASESQVKNLYENIADNWSKIRDEREREILIEYSERARKITIWYTVILMTSCSLITILLPMSSKILDAIDPLDEPRPAVYFMEGEYFVDRNEHFLPLFFCDFTLATLSVFITAAVDPMYVASCEHACALYAIISYRLRNSVRATYDNSATCEGESYSVLVSTMELHQKALRFTSTISDTYSMCFLFFLVINVPLIPLDACAILSHLHTPFGLLLYVILLGMIVGHLFIQFWPGQRILDHGVNLYVDAYCNQWYAVPQPTRKLLLVFMLRCTQPALVSAGGLFLMNYELFGRIMRTAVSYIAVLASFRKN